MFESTWKFSRRYSVWIPLKWQIHRNKSQWDTQVCTGFLSLQFDLVASEAEWKNNGCRRSRKSLVKWVSGLKCHVFFLLQRQSGCYYSHASTLLCCFICTCIRPSCLSRCSTELYYWLHLCLSSVSPSALKLTATPTTAWLIPRYSFIYKYIRPLRGY